MEQMGESLQDMRDPKQQNRFVKRMIICIVIIAFIGLGIGLFPYFMPLEQKGTLIVYEVGMTVSEDVHDYVTGNSKALEKAAVDVSKVNPKRAGEYPVVVKQGLYRYEYMICIVDTTAPQLICGEGPFILEKDKSYDLDFFEVEASDLSGQVTVGLSYEGAEEQKDYKSDISYNDTGYFILQIQASDASGNLCRQQIQVLVDDGPEIIGVKDIYQVPDWKVDYLEGVQSVDFLDGDLTDTIEVDTSEVDCTKPGLYTIRYLNADRYGFETVAEATVCVIEPKQLQEKINTHQINRTDCRIEGALNSYDSGFYETDDVTRVLENTEPAVVGICPEKGYWGSGFIMEINAEEVIVCTNQHVLENYSKADIFFHDGSKARGQIAGTVYDQDIGFVKVKVEDLSEELLNTLRTVHINRTYWEKLEENAELSLCMRTIAQDGSVWRDRTGILLDKTTKVPEGIYYRSVDPITEMDLKLFHGCSGSAVLDGYGNLIAMAAAHTEERYFGIYLTNILDAFEEVFGREVYYE